VRAGDVGVVGAVEAGSEGDLVVEEGDVEGCAWGRGS
jgi:hypothetical protein